MQVTVSMGSENTVKMMGVNVIEKSITTYEQFMKYWRAGA
jgi:hypothetical protein